MVDLFLSNKISSPVVVKIDILMEEKAILTFGINGANIIQYVDWFNRHQNTLALT